MKNIVTIDFDIIMEPDINLYNNWVSDEENVNDFIKEYKVLENLKADLYIYEHLTRYITKVIQKLEPKNIYFIESHETIARFTGTEVFNLWNIDHHHDITYDDDNIILPIINCNCGDWVKYLMDFKRIHKYTWIANENSIDPHEDVDKNYQYEKRTLKEYNLDKLAEQTDALFICRSSTWVPEYYFPLFDAWIAICEEYYKESFHII